MLLTILIPTRNRRSRVLTLVASLRAALEDMRDAGIEVLVVDNQSTDGTAQALAPYATEAIRILTNSEYIPTSEQNVIANFHQARGEFIWFLGDDDVPRPGGLKRLVDQLQEDTVDLFVSNFRVIDEHGRLVSPGQVRGAPVTSDVELVELVRRIGLVNAFAGWSIIVARKSRLDPDLAQPIVAITPIYAHCFWFLRCFATARVRFLGDPLVDYRIFHDRQGWLRTTATSSVSYLHQWHIGLLRLYRNAVDDGLMTTLDISQIFEYRHTGTRYRAVDEIACKLVEQADVYVETRDARNLIGRRDLAWACAFLNEIDLSLQDTLARIAALYEPLWLASASEIDEDDHAVRRADVEDLIVARDRDLYAPFFVVSHYGYSIYARDGSWIAIREDASARIDSVFAQYKPRALPPSVLVESSRAELIEAIATSRPVFEPVGARPPLISTAWSDDEALGRALLGRAQGVARADAQSSDAGEPRALWVGHAAAVGARLPAVRLGPGWSGLEPTGVWSIGSRSVLWVWPPPDTARIVLRGVPFLPPGESRTFTLARAWSVAGPLRLAPSEPGTLAVDVRGAHAPIQLVLWCEASPTPAALGQSSDDRALGFFLEGVWADANAA